MENGNDIIKDLLHETSLFLSRAINKSGVRYNQDELMSLINLCVGVDKKRSFFLGELITPEDGAKDVKIYLYIDAIIDYASFLGIDYWSVLAKVAFCQVHHYLQWKSGKEIDYDKAEQFGSKICRKLYRQGLITDTRMQMYLGNSNTLILLARQKWVEKWSGIKLEELLRSAMPQAVSENNGTDEELRKAVSS
mgnify:FL=1